ncbi:unnamed protein product, partial [Polarella glacialis]
DQELGGLDAASVSLVEGVSASVEEVLAMEAWGSDGTGLKSLMEALRRCVSLRRVDFLGELPDDLDLTALRSQLCSAATTSASARRCEVCVNTPGGFKRAMAVPRRGLLLGDAPNGER